MSKETPVKYGTTKGFCGGAGNSASTKCGTEDHNLPKAKGKRVQVPISKKVTASTDTLLDESKVNGKRSEPSAVAKVRSANNLRRDQNSNLGRGKSSEITLGD